MTIVTYTTIDQQCNAKVVRAATFCTACSNIYPSKMESWLGDVKRVRIPRPKFGSKYPVEPPKDYLEDCGDLGKQRRHDKDLTKATEELRRSLQEKL
ncbi:hypothetical protein B5X24_HaOG213238 [Helicoverpa armigera]|nr:hypothetical protein B5X24_HaOG213238 [Helicoverpa armigera]